MPGSSEDFLKTYSCSVSWNFSNFWKCTTYTAYLLSGLANFPDTGGNFSWGYNKNVEQYSFNLSFVLENGPIVVCWIEVSFYQKSMNFLLGFWKFRYNFQEQRRTSCWKYLENQFVNLNTVIGNGRVVIIITSIKQEKSSVEGGGQ